ncbi:MAG: hypothetical protein SP4CHLAM5_02400 [Chlamydiia bacterium]|nr:hypothetical protein [Chlamydiia bacterium]MCH9618114.1 hypothetical protein [Chlamydiia bacterium]MCH9623994.1 hypothetical protein [Chlamydiia bacterium]
MHIGCLNSYFDAGQITHTIMLTFLLACKDCSQRNLLQNHQKSITTLRNIAPIIIGAIHGEMTTTVLLIKRLNNRLNRLNDTLYDAQEKVSSTRRQALKQAARSKVAIAKEQVKNIKNQRWQAERKYLSLCDQVDWIEKFTILKL